MGAAARRLLPSGVSLVSSTIRESQIPRSQLPLPSPIHGTVERGRASQLYPSLTWHPVSAIAARVLAPAMPRGGRTCRCWLCRCLPDPFSQRSSRARPTDHYRPRSDGYRLAAPAAPALTRRTSCLTMTLSMTAFTAYRTAWPFGLTGPRPDDTRRNNRAHVHVTRLTHAAVHRGRAARQRLITWARSGQLMADAGAGTGRAAGIAAAKTPMRAA